MPPHSDQERWLKRTVATLCHLDNERYVAPVSLSNGFYFNATSRTGFLADNQSAFLQRTWTSWKRKSASCVDCPSRVRRYNCGAFGSFWVAEKSDGIRVLLLVQTEPSGDQMVYLVSTVFARVARKNA